MTDPVVQPTRTTLSARSLSNALATAIDLGCRLVCSIAVARILGTDGAGAVAYGLWLADLAVVLAGAGLPTALVRFAAERTGDAAAQRALGRHVAGATSALALAGAAAVFAYSTDLEPRARALVAGLVVARALEAVLRAYWTGIQRFDLLSRFNALTAPVWLALVAVGGWALGVDGALAGYVGAALVPAVLGLWLAARPGAPLEAGAARRLWGTASFAWVSAVVTALIWGRFELYFLRHAHGEGAAGLYAAGLTLAGLATSGPLMFAGALMPHFSERIAAGDPGAVRATYAAATRLLALSLFPACLATAALAPALIPALYGEAFRGAIPAAAILVAGSAVAATSVGSALLLGADRAHVIAVSGVALTIAAVLLHGWAVPIWGPVGAAVGRGVLQLAGAAWGAVYIARVLGCPVPLAALARTFVAAIVSALACHAVVTLGSGQVWTVAPGALVAVFCYVLAGRVLGILDPADRAHLERAFERWPRGAAVLARRVLGLVARHE